MLTSIRKILKFAIPLGIIGVGTPLTIYYLSKYSKRKIEPGKKYDRSNNIENLPESTELNVFPQIDSQELYNQIRIENKIAILKDIFTERLINVFIKKLKEKIKKKNSILTTGKINISYEMNEGRDKLYFLAS